MNTTPIVSKVWSFCTTLRDDGVSYGDGIVTLIVLSRKGPHGFPFRRPHSRFPIH